MFQWMGGSRRKVTTHNCPRILVRVGHHFVISVEDWQRQYFEQRKRQNQHQLQQSSCIEKSIHEPNGGTQHHKEHLSLDILNLLNLSSNSHSEVYKAPSINGSEINASLGKHHCAKSPSTFLVSKATLNNFSEFREECLVNCGSNAVADDNDRRLLRSGQAESVALNNCKDACTDPDHHNNACKEMESRSNQWTAGEEQLSVLGLFGDDEEHGDQAQSPVQEAHVAFSVEGLGRVGTKTPCHSPQQNGTFYSPVKTTRHRNFSLELNIGLDDVEFDMDEMIQDCHVPYSSSYSEYTLGLTDKCGKMKQKNFPLKSNFRLGLNGKTNWHHGDMNMFWDSEKDHDIWDRSRFLDGEFAGENECYVSWKNWSRQTENNIAELFGYGNSEVPNASNEVPHLLRKSVGKKTMDGFNFFEPGALCFDHQTSENNLGLNMHGMARHPAVAVNCDFGDKANPAYWFSSAAEDAKESFSSLLSEESCSSSAARVEVNNGSIPQHGTERKQNNYFSSENEDGYRNIFASEQQCKQSDYMKYGDKAKRLGTHVNMANTSKSKPLHSHYPSTANLGSYARLFEKENNSFEINSGVKAECPSVEINSGRSFHQIPPKEAQTFGSIPRTKGPESCFSMSEPGEPVMHSLSGSFIPENFTARQLFDSNNSYDEPPALSKFGFVPMELKSGTDLIFGSISTDNIQATGSCGRFVSPVTSAQESMNMNEENKLKLPYTCEKLELGKGIWMEKKDLDSCHYNSNEVKEGSPELKEKKHGKEESPQEMDDVEATHSSDCVEEKKLPLSIFPSEAAITVYKKKHNHDDGGVHLQHQEGGQDNVGIEESNTVAKRMRGDSISKVMLLESYALQLLCVQKVLKA